MANLGFFKEVMAEAVDRAKGAVVEKTQAAVGKAREMVGLVDASAEPSAPPPEPSILDELNQYCSLTLKQRIYGFATCLCIGILCTLMSILVFPHPIKFALTYSIGNLMAIGSTGFLIGFTRQLKMMFDPIRIGAAIVFVLSLVLTLVAALYVQDALLTLLCIVVQACSLIWYSLSYIPFAQSSAKRCMRMCYEAEF
ncbi:unnamed protein product [Closterium sp. Naga37s-1]|nr:unnamed protein product [Closterium sp. Naga37s-1]